MRHVVLVAALLATQGLALAQDGVAMSTSNVAPVTSVSPGKVHWHASLAEAVAAARETGKPVLHFQLLGALDQEFC